MRWTILAMLLAACAIALPAAGCGGSDGDEPEAEAEADAEGASEEAREEAEREAAAESIPEADRIAYYQVATGSGLLRSWADAVAKGDEPPANAGDAEIRAAARRLDGLDRPDSARLEELVAELGHGLHLALGGGARPSLAPDLIDLSDEVNRGLQRYLRDTPQVSILLPD